MGSSFVFGPSTLSVNAAQEVARISAGIRGYLARYNRKGMVVAMSGGIDSSVVASLCVAAVGRARVLGLHLPERESSSDTLRLSRMVSNHLGIATSVEDISPILDAVGCYRRRNEAIRMVCPDFEACWKVKIVLPSMVDGDNLHLFSLVVSKPDGTVDRYRLTKESYLGILAATNFKQRIRKMLEYYHADRLDYAVAGTPNRLEYDQGFFVKLGDGAADFKPIAHLYKTQVYQLAEFLGIPEEIRSRSPTTDTYSMPQSQEEFYFSLPYKQMDLCLYGMNNGIPIELVAAAAHLSKEQVTRVYRDIERKRHATEYLHLSPQLALEVPEIMKDLRSVAGGL